MPLQREHIQFTFILLCVPIQYMIVHYSGSTESSRTYHISLIVNQAKQVYHKWFTVASWSKWLMKTAQLDPGTGESMAVEVLKYREKKQNGYFSSSSRPRAFRTHQVQFRIGQVIKHKKWGYRGVIIGWDESAKAPENWLKQMHDGHPEWRKQPNYSILVDTRDRTEPQITYVPQENIDILRSVKVQHPKMSEYFEHFDGSQYIPRPWLRNLYPMD